MHKQKKESFVDRYSAKLSNMDKEASKWKSDVRTQYENSRDEFRKNLDAWQEISEDKWDEFKDNIESTWTGLESEWQESKQSNA